MIEKERLEELIKQGATIYSTTWKEEIDLSQYWCEVFEMEWNGKIITKLVVHYDDEHCPLYLLEGLTEDIEGAKWEEEFGCITRTERLELPTWEEFIEMEEFCFFQKNHKQTIIGIIVNKYIVVETNFERYYTGILTKENYIKACEYARGLFLGEKQWVKY